MRYDGALEIERGRVDAVALARRAGPVVEDVAEMTSAGRARDLGASHPMARVGLGDDAVEVGGLDEARPAGPGVELVLGAEELRPATGTAVDAGRMLVPVRAGECALGPLPRRISYCSRGQAFLPLASVSSSFSAIEARVASTVQAWTRTPSRSGCSAA